MSRSTLKASQQSVWLCLALGMGIRENALTIGTYVMLSFFSENNEKHKLADGTSLEKTFRKNYGTMVDQQFERLYAFYHQNPEVSPFLLNERELMTTLCDAPDLFFAYDAPMEHDIKELKKHKREEEWALTAETMQQGFCAVDKHIKVASIQNTLFTSSRQYKVS